MTNPKHTYGYDPTKTWEYNLIQNVRWGTDDEKDDVCFYVRVWLDEIVKEEKLDI